MDQTDLFEVASARTLLDQLLADSRLYKNSAEYMQLLEFVARMRNFAPFNAMLLRIQKPGVLHAASSRDWRERFGREVMEGARPLLILWPFAPVALVYDVADTYGPPLPDGLEPFMARGWMDDEALGNFSRRILSKGILCKWVDAGAGWAGSISLERRSADRDQYSAYLMQMNDKHDPNVQFATLVHELAHLYLGHLGRDPKLSIPERSDLSLAKRELEAESVSFMVCERNGVSSRADTYLSGYVGSNTTTEHLDLYQIMRAAGQVETLLGLGAKAKY
jgi:hypothetical protein